MEPRIQGIPSPEMSMDQPKPQTHEAISGNLGPERSTEQSQDGRREAREVLREGPGGDPGTSVPPLPPVLDTSLVVQPAADDSQSSSASGMPTQAADVDLIEKEWVDRAKLIVSQTRDDPHEQESEVGKLQAEYLKQRYGRDINTVNGG